MNIKHVLFAAALTILTPVLKADFVETNLTVTLKFYFNQTEATTKGDVNSRAYTTATLKNKDIIDSVAYVYDYNFTTTARLMRRDEFDAEGNFVSHVTFIRDKNEGDIDITSLVPIEEYDGVNKFRYSVSKGTGLYNSIYNGRIRYIATPANENSEEIDVMSLNKGAFTFTLVRSTSHFVSLANITSTVHGYAYMFYPKSGEYYNGVVEGTIKTSGAKVVVPVAQ